MPETRLLAVGLLLFMFALVALVSVNSLRAVIPSEAGALELRVRALYELKHRYKALMGLAPSWTRGNRLYRLADRDLDPLDGATFLKSSRIVWAPARSIPPENAEPTRMASQMTTSLPRRVEIVIMSLFLK